MKIDNRIWIALTVLISGAILAGAWFLGASPFLAGASTARAETADVDGRNQTASVELASLQKDKADLSGLEARASTLAALVPHGVDATRFIDQVNSTASSTGVEVKSITLSAPAAYTPAVAVATAGTPGSASSPSASPSPSASASASAAPAAPAGPVAPAPVADPLIDASNFVVVPVTINVGGTNDQVLAFLDGLQHGKRLVLVTTLSTSTQDAGGVELTIGGSIYVLKSKAAVAGASANG